MFDPLLWSRRASALLSGRRCARPALESLEGRALLAEAGMLLPSATVSPLDVVPRSLVPRAPMSDTVRSSSREHGLKADAVPARPKSLEQVVAMTRERAGRGASNAKIVQEFMTLLNQHIGFYAFHNVPHTPAGLQSVLTKWDQGYGYDCLTLCTVTWFALKKAHFPGNYAVNTYIPSPSNPDVAITGDLSNPKVLDPANPVTDPITGAQKEYFEALFTRPANANYFEGALTYTDKGKGKAKTYYYPGGVRIPNSGGINVVYDNPSNLLTVFSSLGWCCSADLATGFYDIENGILHPYPGLAPSIPLR